MTTTKLQLTPDERRQRDLRQERQDAARMARIGDELIADLAARTPKPDAPGSLPMDALRQAMVDAEAQLIAALSDAGLGYAVAAALNAYRRDTSGLIAAAAKFRPTPPLGAKEAETLAERLYQQIDAIAAGQVRAAIDERDLAASRERTWLAGSLRNMRRIPASDAANDARDNAAFARMTDPAEREQPYLEIATGSDGQHVPILHNVPEDNF